MTTPPTLHPSAEKIVWSHGRLVVLCAIGVVWLLGNVGRLWYLQVKRHDHYAARAAEQQRDVVELDAPRGTIRDARGRALAVSVEAFSVAVDPQVLELSQQKDATAADLARILSLDEAELRARLDSDRRFLWVRRKVDREVAEVVRALDRHGVILLPESKREYPYGRLAAQLIGTVGTDDQGLAGLEAHYDKTVRTEKGRTTVVRDGLAATLANPGARARDAARPGKDLYLTIDVGIQHILERELLRGVESSGARSGQAVMLDPGTGAVLAMAAVPSYDPNRFAQFPRERWRIPAVHDAFEPGSTFKMVTLTAALESGGVDPLAPIDCGHGQFAYGNTIIRDHKSFGALTVRQVIAHSSNVGAIHLGRMAGEDLFYATVRRFGFGKPTGIDLPAESAGQLRPPERWSATDPFYISFGQGVAVTSLQMANAFAAIANGGRLMRPYVVASIGEPPGEPRREVVQVVAAPSSVRQVRSILEDVVLDGTAKSAGLDGYRAAGKTGTAQKVIGGRYDERRHVASFVGFAPVERPALVLAVTLDEPWPRYHGGDVAAPIFRAIAQDTLLYLGVPPSTPRGASPADRLDGIRLASRDPEDVGGNTSRRADTVASLRAGRLDEPLGSVPDYRGLSAREAVRLSATRQLTPLLRGHGVVVQQDPPPGTPDAEAGGRVELWLRIDAAAGGTTLSPSPSSTPSSTQEGAR